MESDQEAREILETLRANARKLVVLIEHSTMPDDVKDAWIALLPEMSVKQLDRFLSVLETKYLDEQTKGIDAEYKEKISALVDRFEKDKVKEDEETVKTLESVKKVISLL